MVVHTINPSTQEAGTSRPQNQPGLHSEFQNKQDYVEKPVSKTQSGLKGVLPAF